MYTDARIRKPYDKRMGQLYFNHVRLRCIIVHYRDGFRNTRFQENVRLKQLLMFDIRVGRKSLSISTAISITQ